MRMDGLSSGWQRAQVFPTGPPKCLVHHQTCQRSTRGIILCVHLYWGCVCVYICVCNMCGTLGKCDAHYNRALPVFTVHLHALRTQV